MGVIYVMGVAIKLKKKKEKERKPRGREEGGKEGRKKDRQTDRQFFCIYKRMESTHSVSGPPLLLL